MLYVSSTNNAAPARKSSNESMNNDVRQQQLKVANEYIVSGYDLVWQQEDYAAAIEILLKALKLQQSHLGKHHKDVGYTCNFIATAYWLQDVDPKAAFRYFLEARRIFCKTGDVGGATLVGIDERIHCLLLRYGLTGQDQARAKYAIETSIAHELQGGRLKEQGLVQAAKQQYKKAKRVASVLRQLLV